MAEAGHGEQRLGALQRAQEKPLRKPAERWTQAGEGAHADLEARAGGTVGADAGVRTPVHAGLSRGPAFTSRGPRTLLCSLGPRGGEGSRKG